MLRDVPNNDLQTQLIPQRETEGDESVKQKQDVFH